MVNYFVPWTSPTSPGGCRPGRIAGTVPVVALYGLMILAFWRLF
jgi:hypothetical protein